MEDLEVDHTATLLVTCPDRKGLVAALSTFLYQHGANILEAEQYTNTPENMFFQRIVFDASKLDASREDFERKLKNECQRLSMMWKLNYREPKKRVAIFVSQYEHCLFDLLIRHRQGELPCEIVVVVGNHTSMNDVTTMFHIPFYYFNTSERAWQGGAECNALRFLKDLSVDLVILARFMRILGAEFVSAFEYRIINIHHGFLPAFQGAKPYHQAYERGVKLIGATAHYATMNLDEGPIIAQDVVPCSHRDSPKDLVLRGRDVERMVLARAVQAHLEDRIIVYQNRTIVFF